MMMNLAHPAHHRLGVGVTAANALGMGMGPYSSTAPYGNVVKFNDGSSVSMQRRERPHLVFDQHGFITHLSTGVQPSPTKQKSRPSLDFQTDYTYTLVQPVSPVSGTVTIV